MPATLPVIVKALRAFRKGDFSVRLPQDWTGEWGDLADLFNETVELQAVLTSELQRLAKTVGRDGQINARAELPGAVGGWQTAAQAVNGLIADIVHPVTEVGRLLESVARGDLSVSMELTMGGRPMRGEFLRMGKMLNAMVEQLNSFASEVTRVAREVGSEGLLGGQAKVKGVAGTWKDLTDNVNLMAANLTAQVRNIAQVTTAVANGDLSRKITVDVKGEIAELKETINRMVDQLNSFASEVTRVAREVGTEGKLGGQADVKGVGGTWKDLTDSVNVMADNLTGQVRNIAEVTTAVARGDLSRKITVDVRGEIAGLKDTINTMVDQLNAFASEVTRVAREVGAEGKLGGQAKVEGVEGTWRDLTQNVNMMAANLTDQVRNIADVTTAVANGDLSRKITVDVHGEVLELKLTINTMVDQLNSFASEVTRVAREVGTEGKLGGQADVKGVGGTWKDLTNNVNLMAENLTGQVRNIADVTTAVAKGDLSRKITVDAKGEILELKSTVNTMVDQLNSFASEVTRVAREVGADGKLGGQAKVEGVEGTWRDLTQNVNMMAANLTDQVRNIADVTKAVARGDLSRKITVDVRGEIAELKDTINTMVDQLNAFASEVTRVAREVGTLGKLGGQADVKGVGGTWKDLTENVNMMAANLTDQVRGIATVVTAVAQGDLKRKLQVEAKGEIAALADTVNEMIDTLATFADQVTNVAREVGVDGKLGGQAKVPSAAGLWRELTDNVNMLADNLTRQVRAIADVATAVAAGDLDNSINVDAAGEVAALKDNLNQMIRNLRDTTSKNAEQDWLKTNLARFTRMLQGERDLANVSNMVLSELAPLVNAQRGVFYLMEETDGEPALDMIASYAFTERKRLSNRFRLREGLVGQAAYERKRILLTNVPGDYVVIGSGLGEAAPLNIIVLPILFEQQVRAVIELASFSRFSETHQSFLDQLMESIGIVINTITVNSRTEALLKQSQGLTVELQKQQQEMRLTNDRLEDQAANLRRSEETMRAQQDELQRTNEELEEKARLLEIQKREVEDKNQEVSIAKTALEEKAEQLSLTSRYKSQFLANMSHELRTPLNSLLILSKLLSENGEGNLSPKQTEFASTIHSAGADLLALINDILDLSKIESGTVSVDLGAIAAADVVDNLERTFRPVAEDKGVAFEVIVGPGFPTTLETDAKRLQQVLRNLLSNAFKFTHQGGVTLRMERSMGLDLKPWLIWAVTDTGIGIAPEKQRIVFEAFQQADGTTSRAYGGTGLGLAISREIARLFGGDLTVRSALGQGSTFTLSIPETAPDVAPLSVSPPVSPPPARELETYTPSEPRRAVAANDDRFAIGEGDDVVLIVEDDANFASVLLDLAREHGFRGLVAGSGAEALALAKTHPVDALTLDIGLPDMDGWALLAKLREFDGLASAPVHIISVQDQEDASKSAAGAGGAILGYMEKPVDREALMGALTRSKAMVGRPLRSVLLVEDDQRQRMSIQELLRSETLQVIGVGTARGALEACAVKRFDLMIVDLGLPDMNGAELIAALRRIDGQTRTPIIVYTGRSLDEAERAELERQTETILIKDADSIERLVGETGSFLSAARKRGRAAPERRDPPSPRASAFDERQADVAEVMAARDALKGRGVMIIDDDIRNIFSLSSALEAAGMKVRFAKSGREGGALLEASDDVEVALIDIMMPEMDGYETIQAIRAIGRLSRLPLVAVTAKAMPGDRERCLEAGADDYLSKPVDLDRLFLALGRALAEGARR